MSSRALLPLLLAAALACGPRADPRLVAQPIAERTWVSPLHRDHPLVGRIWEPRAARYVDEGALSAAVAGADFVLLGEVHDNVDHHLLQARLVRAVLASGRRPALAFEMLTEDQQPLVDAALARAPKDPNAVAKAVDWKHSRWPEFAVYRPIFAAGLEAGLPIVAANLPRAEVKAIVSKGKEALDEDLRARLARDEPLPEPVLAALREEMRESHCGELPEPMLDPLVLAQRARDAQMAARLATAGDGRGGILITGKGHVRTDRGVPAALSKDAPGRAVVAVAFVEVDPEQREPTGYGEEEGTKGTLPYDFVVFTPGAEREDPCEGMRERTRQRAEETKETTTAAPDAPAPPASPGTAVPRGD
jgi:uncharacterized iron-regulated protein